MGNRVRVTVEAIDKKVFVSALDWPGWSRSGKTEELAVEAFLAAAPRYAVVAKEAGLDFDAGDIEVEEVEREAGDASTAFGVPGAIGRRGPATGRCRRGEAAGGDRRGRLGRLRPGLRRGARGAPQGPRGGGRDRTKIVGHVNDSDGGYATVMGIKEPDVAARRVAMLEVLRKPSDGSPIAGRKWPPRYAARRIAWHALDHAWEIEDRTEPA